MTDIPTRPAVVPRQRSAATELREAIPGRPPILPRSYVPRRRLAKSLDAATRDAGVTMLVAPAGAGKTHGVAGWVRDRRRHEDAIWVPKADTLTTEDLVLLT